MRRKNQSTTALDIKQTLKQKDQQMNYLIRLNGSDDKIEIITEDEMDMYKKNYDVEILEQSEKYFTKKYKSVCISIDVDCDVTLAYMKLK